MTYLQIVVSVAALAVKGITVGLLVAWLLKNDPALTGRAFNAKVADRFARALLALALVCIAGGVIGSGYLAYRMWMGAA